MKKNVVIKQHPIFGKIISMKKQLLTLATVFLTGITVWAQDIKETTADINATSQTCVLASYTMTYDVVDGAWTKKMGDMKISKPSKTKDGYKLYKGVKIPEISAKSMDYYVKMEERKPSTNFYLIMSLGYTNFLNRTAGDSVALDNAKAYLTKFMVDLNAYQLNKDIVAQQDQISDIEKRMKNAVKQEESLNKEKGKIQSKISSNEIEIQALKSDMESQQTALEAVKQKIATIDQMEALKKEVSKQEETTKKATKKYEKALENAGEYKTDLQKNESALNDNATEQLKIKSELNDANNKLEDLKKQLAALKQ